jgi:hypothetical protein
MRKNYYGKKIRASRGSTTSIYNIPNVRNNFFLKKDKDTEVLEKIATPFLSPWTFSKKTSIVLYKAYEEV